MYEFEEKENEYENLEEVEVVESSEELDDLSYSEKQAGQEMDSFVGTAKEAGAQVAEPGQSFEYSYAKPDGEIKSQKNKKGIGKKILSYVLIAAISLCCGFAGAYIANIAASKSQLGPGKSGGSSDLADIHNISFTEGEVKNIAIDENGDITIVVDKDYSLAEVIAEKVMPSVVSVTTVYEASVSSGDIFDYFWGGGRSYTQEATAVGTGFIVDENGYILTNSHVVNDGKYKSIIISLFDGTDEKGEVLWNDSTLDLAIVKIDKKNLPAAELGDSDLVKIGAYAAAIGNPLGLTFERSMSQGIISGLNRTITVSSDGTNATIMEGLMQTDAAINSGNSGGPLLNAKGEVIAIASAKAANGENMGFAIPINVAKPIIDQIKNNGKFERVYLGISAIGIEEQNYVNKQSLEDYYGSSKGIYVAAVTKGGGAEKAGIKEHDVILKVNGIEVGTMNKMYSVLIAFKAGDSVEVTYLRDKKEYKTNVVLMTADQLNGTLQ